MTQCPVCPWRLRTRSVSKTGLPQFSSFAGEDAARTCQRVSAVLASDCALKRRRKAVTPLPALARVSRRLATRSRTEGSPAISNTTAPSAAQESASDAARNTPAASTTRNRSKRSGSSPSSRNPGAASSPNWRMEKSCWIQSTRLFAAARKEIAAANPEAEASWPLCEKISCSAPRRNPPFKQRSAPLWPNGTRACLAGNSVRASEARRATIFALCCSRFRIGHAQATKMGRRIIATAPSSMRLKQMSESGQESHIAQKCVQIF